jgi:hypothetical protein
VDTSNPNEPKVRRLEIGQNTNATSAPIKSPMDGSEVVIVTAWERLE